MTRVAIASRRGAIPAHPRPSTEHSTAPVSMGGQPSLVALNLLSLWFASQLFFNEKTAALSSTWLDAIRPERLLLLSLVSYVLLFSRGRHLRRLKIVKEEVLMFLFFGIILTSCLLFARPLKHHLSTVFSLIGYPMFVFWLCRRIPFKQSNIARLVAVMIAIGGYLGLCGVCEHYDWHLFIFRDYIFDPSVGIHYGRSRGPFVQAPIFGGVLCLIALVTLWFLNNVKARVITVMLLGLMIASIYLTDTRAVWLELALSVLILGMSRSNMRRYTYGAALILLAVFVSGTLSKFSLYEVTLFKRRDEAALSRVVLATASLEFVKNRPLMGSGYGTFADAGTDRRLDREQQRLVQMEGNHHTILGLLVEVGIVGTLPYLMILAGFLLQSVRLWRLSKNKNPAATDFAVSTLAALIGFLFLIQFDDVRFATFLNSLLFAICGFAFAWMEDLQSLSRDVNKTVSENPSRLSNAARLGRQTARMRHPVASARR